MVSLEGFLLAGGASRRMGRDKARLRLGGASFVARVEGALAPHVARVRIVGRRWDEGGLSCIEDLRPGLGPLAGIESALAHAGGAGVFVVACDLPLVTADFLGLVAGRAASAPETIVVPADAEGRVAPLCGVYPARALATASRLLDAGERRPRALLDAFPSLLIHFEDYAHLPGAERLLRNVNTPSEYEALLE
jgi:molybdopterin-guanine dinucleotide biosynthesis protein A